ncbi:hypothetical protein WN51_07968 [Melipona quadrifasciata]|uniref:Uncharacterized protein n=1 Tax=Melipona quadrifasciata TaxID=166423 RepID=A0A0M8ZPI4_9HYME|nr:hypothetical protein WN51_07968 [Melipona quadrifasciata]
MPRTTRSTYDRLRLTSASPVNTETPPVARLPVIALPQFHGALEEWVCFCDSFENMIHRNELLTNIDRFHYLISAVKGELSDRNYEAAWECENAMRTRTSSSTPT